MPGKEKKNRPSQKQRKSVFHKKYFETSEGKQFLLDAKEQAEINATAGKLEAMDTSSTCASSTVAKRRSPKTPAAFPTHSRQSSKGMDSQQLVADDNSSPSATSTVANRRSPKTPAAFPTNTRQNNKEIESGQDGNESDDFIDLVAWKKRHAADRGHNPSPITKKRRHSSGTSQGGEQPDSSKGGGNKQKNTRKKQKHSSVEQTVQLNDGAEAQLLPQVFEDVAQPAVPHIVDKKKRESKKKRCPSVDESVQSESGGELQVLSQLSTNSKSSRTSNKSDVEKTVIVDGVVMQLYVISQVFQRRLDQLLEKYSNVVEAVDKDENCHISNDQLIQERLISYFAKELAEVEDDEGDEEIDQGDDMTRAAVKDIVDRMSPESLKNDPGRLVLLNSFSNATVSRRMFGGFRKWLQYCKETGRDYKEFDKAAATAFLIWLKNQTFKRRGGKPQHYCGTVVEGYLVSAYMMLRVGGYYRSDQRLKDVLGHVSFIAARYCRRNIGTDKQNRAQITLIPDEIDLLSLQLPFDTPAAVQNLLYIHMISNLGLRPSSVLRGRPSENPNQMGLLVKDISFKRDSNLRLRMTLRFRFFKDVVDRGQYKDHVVRERDNPFCLVRLTLLHLLMMGCLKVTSPNFMRQGEIKVRPPRDDINLFCATDANDCLLVGMPMYNDQLIWNGLARKVGLPEHGVSARSCRRGFVTATALSLVSDDVDSTVEKLLQLLRSLNMWRGNAALSYIEQDLYWLANVAEKLHPNQPVSFKVLPAKLVWQYAYHRCIDKDEYEDPSNTEMRERVKASPYFKSTLNETIDEKKKKKEPVDLVRTTSNVLAALCTRMANESNRKGYDDKAAEISVKPLPDMPLEVLDVELIAKELAGKHIENLSFLFPAGLPIDSEKCPVVVLCDAVGCHERFTVTGDYETHRLQHVAAQEKFICKAAQSQGTALTSKKHKNYLHRHHYFNRTCDVCGKRCSSSQPCRRVICKRSDNWTSSPVPLFIAQFLGVRKVVVDEGNIRHVLESVDKIRICDEVAGSAIQSYPLLPIVPRRRRFDQLEGSFKGEKYGIYKNTVKEFNQTLKILELRRKAVEEAEKLMDDNDSDSD